MVTQQPPYSILRPAISWGGGSQRGAPLDLCEFMEKHCTSDPAQKKINTEIALTEIMEAVGHVFARIMKTDTFFNTNACLYMLVCKKTFQTFRNYYVVPCEFSW